MTRSPRDSLGAGQTERRLAAPLWRQARRALTLVQVRLRLPLVLVVAALVVD
jgi:hypothetical protein